MCALTCWTRCFARALHSRDTFCVLVATSWTRRNTRARAREYPVRCGKQCGCTGCNRHQARPVDKFRLSRPRKPSRSPARQYFAGMTAAFSMHFKFTVRPLNSSGWLICGRRISRPVRISARCRLFKVGAFGEIDRGDYAAAVISDKKKRKKRVEHRGRVSVSLSPRFFPVENLE